MRDRLSSFSDPEIIKLLQEKFIPATDNDFYNRRRKDEVGKFFMSVANQGPRSEGSGTTQGHYIIAPSGKLLGFNNNRDKWNRMKFINEALKKWDALPDAEKKPGAVDVPPLSELTLDSKHHSEIPEGGITLVASSRILKKENGNYAACTADDHDHEWGHLAAIDRMWIQKGEWEKLVAIGKTGGAIDPRLANRLARFHFMDFTRGEPATWNLEDVKTLTMTAKPLSDSSFAISGKVLVSDDTRGFDAELLAIVELDENDRPTRFDIVILGGHWGHSEYTGGSRPGKTPLGIAFRLGDPTKPEDQIRPQASHWMQAYWEAEKAH